MIFDASILAGLMPIFVVILSGYVFRRIHFPGDDFWSYVEQFTYFVLFPSLLLQKTATASLDLSSAAPMVGALSVAVMVMAGLLLLIRPLWKAGPTAFTSFFQGSIRFNTYVGLSAAYALFSDEGVTLAALAISLLIPLVNFLCVIVLVVFAHPGGSNWRTVVTEIIRNPLIIACTLGLGLNISGVHLSQGVSETLKIFGRASLPLGLLAVGAGLNITAARRTGKIVMLSCGLKLIVLPVIMWTACRVLNLDNTSTAVAVLFAALPGSASSYILARQLGGDSVLMANIVTVQIVLSMLTLPGILALLLV